MMSEDGFECGRNIFDAFLNFVKQEKDDTPRPIDKQPADGVCGKFSPTIPSTGSVSELWIKPESDSIQEPSTRLRTLLSEEQHPIPNGSLSMTQCSVPSGVMVTKSQCETSVTTPSITSVLPSLRISSVINLPEPNPNQVTLLSSSTQETLVPSNCAVTPEFSTNDGNLSVPCPPSPTSTRQSETLESSSNPAEELHARAAQFNFSFGCLDDLLPQNDPARSAYIHHKCTRLRYPLPLAVAMSKLYSPSKVPSSSSDPPSTFKSQCVKKSFRKTHQPDQGFLEIDDSHFTLNATTQQNTSINAVPSMPLTKAQLRHCRFRSEVHNAANPINSPSQENVAALVPAVAPTQSQIKRTKPVDRRRSVPTFNRWSDKKETRAAWRDCHQPLTVTISDSEGSSCEVVSNRDRRHSSSTSSPSLPSERQSVCLTRSLTDQAAESQLKTRSPKRPSSVQAGISALSCSDTSASSKQSMTSPGVSDKEKSVELLAFWLLSSHHFVRVGCVLPPYRVCIHAPHDSRLSVSDFLMFGDVVRILCYLTNSSNPWLMKGVMALCLTSFQTCSPSYVYLKTPYELVPLNTVRLEEHLQFALIPCPPNTIFQRALQMAHNISRTMDWRTCVSTEHMLEMCRVLSKRKPSLPLLSNLPSDNHRACVLISHITRNLMVQLRPCVERLISPSRPGDQHTLLEVDKSFPPELVNFLSPFWCRALSAVLPDNQHIIGLGLLIRSFRMVSQYLFLDSAQSMLVSSSRSNMGPSPTLLDCLAIMHKNVSSCLAHLRDAYPSLIAAGSCLSARVILTKMEQTTDLNQNRYRIELGRARLFDSADTARANVVRVLREEIQPYMHQLLELCHQTLIWGVRLVSDSNLLGPYAQDSACGSTAHCIQLSLMALQHQCQLISRSNSRNSLSPSSPAAFYRIASRIHDFLGKHLAPYIFSFRTALQMLTSIMRQSLSALSDTWIPAFQCPTDNVDWRASVDMQVLVAALQNQFDLLEIWLRSHHNYTVPGLYTQMSSLQSLLMKVDVNNASVANSTPGFVDLSVPYGSKNKSLCKTIPDHMLAIDPLPKWPPSLSGEYSSFLEFTSTVNSGCHIMVPSTSSQSEPTIVLPTDPASMSVLLIPSANTCIEQRRDKFKRFCASSSECAARPLRRTTSLVKTVPESLGNVSNHADSVSCPSTTAVNSDADSTPVGSNGATAAKRVCVYLSGVKNHCTFPVEIISPQSVIPNGNNLCQRTNSMDRRRLGRLKRRMKISHASCAKTRSGFDGDVDTVDVPLGPVEVFSDSSPDGSPRRKQSEDVGFSNKKVTSARRDEVVNVDDSDDELNHAQTDKDASASSPSDKLNGNVNQQNNTDLPTQNVSFIPDKPHPDSVNQFAVVPHEHARKSQLVNTKRKTLITELINSSVVQQATESLGGTSNDARSPSHASLKDSFTTPCGVPATPPNDVILDTAPSVDKIPSVCASKSPSFTAFVDPNVSSPNSSCPHDSSEPSSPGSLIVVVPNEDSAISDPAVPVHLYSPKYESSGNSSNVVPVSTAMQKDDIVISKATVHTAVPMHISSRESQDVSFPSLGGADVNTESTNSLAVEQTGLPQAHSTDSVPLLALGVNCSTVLPVHASQCRQVSTIHTTETRFPASSSNDLLGGTDSAVENALLVGAVTAEHNLQSEVSECSKQSIAFSHARTSSKNRSNVANIQPATYSPNSSRQALSSEDHLHDTSHDCLSVESETNVDKPCSPSNSAATSSPTQSSRIGLVLERVTAELNELVPWLDKCASSYNVPGPITAAILGQSVAQKSSHDISIDLTSDD